MIRRRRWTLLLLGLVILAVLGYAAAALSLAGKIPPGTRVAGIDLGGLSPDAAHAKLTREYAAQAAVPLTLEANNEEVRLAPDELGLTLDTVATLEKAQEGALTPAGLWTSLFGRRDLHPVIKVDEGRLASALTELGEQTDRKPVEARIGYEGLKPVVRESRTGQGIDREQSAQAIQKAYREDLTPARIVLPVGERPPAVTTEEAQQVAESTAKQAVEGPLTLTGSEDKQATLTPEQVAERLTFVNDGQGALRPNFDASGLAGELVGGEPKDATFKIVKGKPRVVPSKPGKQVDGKALGTAIADALAGGTRTVAVPTRDKQPRLTTEKAETLGIKEKVSSFTTNYPCCAPRVTNIHRISEIVDGHVVLPGETFSLNGLVGKRDTARGFVEAPMILNGRFVNDVGGGVSQFATTMFNAVFFGGFQDVQHTPHQFYISRYPAGRESTVSFPQPDFRWKNDSEHGVLIKASYTSTSVTVQFWSTKRFDIESRTSGPYDVKPFPTLQESGPDCISMPGAQGFAIDVWRTFKKDGKKIKEQRFHTVYQPEPKLTCTGG
ncbi:VanW family protein [Nonomuraea sp. NPDC050310]|uniref:VanW family protein n=1 Tax=Nonomuraea sp. NPDC050310 TaxID=3154935 RepID=UPI00340EE585